MSRLTEAMRDLAGVIEHDNLPEPITIVVGTGMNPVVHVADAHAMTWLNALEHTSISHRIHNGLDHATYTGQLPSGMRIDVTSMRPVPTADLSFRRLVPDTAFIGVVWA